MKLYEENYSNIQQKNQTTLIQRENLEEVRNFYNTCVSLFFEKLSKKSKYHPFDLNTKFIKAYWISTCLSCIFNTCDQNFVDTCTSLILQNCHEKEIKEIIDGLLSWQVDPKSNTLLHTLILNRLSLIEKDAHASREFSWKMPRFNFEEKYFAPYVLKMGPKTISRLSSKAVFSENNLNNFFHSESEVYDDFLIFGFDNAEKIVQIINNEEFYAPYYSISCQSFYSKYYENCSEIIIKKTKNHFRYLKSLKKEYEFLSSLVDTTQNSIDNTKLIE